MAKGCASIRLAEAPGAYGEDISIEQVTSHMNMSKRNSIRGFKQAVQVAPIDYIQHVKIEAAEKSLESGKQNIQALTYEVGYNDS